MKLGLGPGREHNATHLDTAFVMAGTHSTDNDSSATGLSLLTAADLYLQERSHDRPLSARTGIKSIDHQFRSLLTAGKVIGLGQSQDDASSVRVTQVKQ